MGRSKCRVGKAQRAHQKLGAIMKYVGGHAAPTLRLLRIYHCEMYGVMHECAAGTQTILNGNGMAL